MHSLSCAANDELVLALVPVPHRFDAFTVLVASLDALLQGFACYGRLDGAGENIQRFCCLKMYLTKPDF